MLFPMSTMGISRRTSSFLHLQGDGREAAHFHHHQHITLNMSQGFTSNST